MCKKTTTITWSPDKILYLAGENKTKCNRVWVRQKEEEKLVFHCHPISYYILRVKIKLSVIGYG